MLATFVLTNYIKQHSWQHHQPATKHMGITMPTGLWHSEMNKYAVTLLLLKKKLLSNDVLERAN